MKDSVLRKLAGVPQSPVHHPEGDALRHTLLVYREMHRIIRREGVYGPERTILLLAALLHDIGKVQCTVVHEDGRITSHGHDRVGATLVPVVLAHRGVDPELIEPVATLVREHMNGRAPLHTLRALNRLDRRLAEGGVNRHLLAMLVEADTRGREL